ncbi:hypothetical protein BDR04DRAFT_1020641 [Suillus decipiens]|nr:hypothetical protein BDR04DRAFT_1020641 [Suillus decipiens]
MVLTDFMHKCKLGTWKVLFAHLIRILFALPQGSQLVAMLDYRYGELIPMFGNSIIHRFSNNTSEMKCLAACDFENILQVFLPIHPQRQAD